jgi:hypothetical protein
MREAKCPGDQKFGSYTGRCGPASSAPMPCGSYTPGNTATKSMTFVQFSFLYFSALDHRNIGIFIQICLTMILFVIFE